MTLLVEPCPLQYYVLTHVVLKELAYSIIYPQQVTVYQVDDLPNSSGETNTTGFLNTFFDSIDGSYCNYTAFGITGDSPGIDPVYPDNSNLTGAYKGQLECGTYQLTRVVSISYGEPEVDVPKPYVERQCNEIMKLVSILTGRALGDCPGPPLTLTSIFFRASRAIPSSLRAATMASQASRAVTVMSLGAFPALAKMAQSTIRIQLPAARISRLLVLQDCILIRQ